MKLTLQRDELLKPLQMASGVVERRQTMPIMSNVLISAHDSQLSIMGTDCEVELVGRSTLQQAPEIAGDITVPGRKLLDICKALPEAASINLELKKDRLILTSAGSRFTLTTLPANEFPTIKPDENATEFTIAQADLAYLTQRTHFSMAQQDVRYYLNGMLLEVKGGTIRTVATDGHRLALNTLDIENKETQVQALIPFKGVHELMRLINSTNEDIRISISKNYLCANGANFSFISKLINGSFPSYDRVVPKNCDKNISMDRHLLKQMLQRVAVLSNDKFRGARMYLDLNSLNIQAHNPQQEEAHEDLHIDYNYPPCELGFNVDYIIAVLDNINHDNVTLHFADTQTPVLIEEKNGNAHSTFVIMPLRL